MARGLVALALCCWLTLAHAADFDFVQSPDIANDNGGPTDLAFGSNVTAGNLLIAVVSRTPGGTATVAKSAGTATISGWARAEDLNAGQHIEIWWTMVTGTGSLTNRFSETSSPANMRFGLAEYVGPAGGVEVIDTAELANAATTTPTSGNLTLTAAGLIVGALTPTTQAVVLTAGTGYTLREVSAIDQEGFEDKKASAGTDAATFTTNVSEASTVVAVAFQEVGAATREQEGFRWGVDDDTESAHTFEAAQDTNISLADNQARLLRALVNATGDAANTAYALRYQKNGSGGYVAVPVGSTTAGAGISNQNVAASADDSQDIGGTNTINGTTIGASLDANTEWVGMRFTNIAIPAGATITAAAVEVVPSGTGEDEPQVAVFFEDADDCATFTTGASNISNRSRTGSVAWSSTNLAADGATYFATPDLASILQTVIDRPGWASGNDVCVIIQGGQGAATRDLTIEAQDLGPNTNPPRLDVSWTVANEVYVSTSANITAGGEATTARLTAPAGKTTSDFVTGRRWDDENGTDSIDITTDDYTEVEWPVFIASSAADGDFFDFRVYAAAAALDTYTVTPRWTIPGAGGALLHRRRMH